VPRQLALVGRDALVRDLLGHALASHAVVAHGPRGIGGTAVLDAIEREVGGAGRPVARVAVLDGLDDLARALALAYLGREPDARAQRTITLALAPARQRPGVLLVDRVGRSSVMVRRAVRDLTAAGTGAILVGVVDRAEDHARLRALALAHRELAIPPLPIGAMRAILDDHAGALKLAAHDRERLLRAASGRPGLLVRMTQGLRSARYWRDGRVLVEPLRADVVASLA
jgi:hypothetical protein